MSDRSPFCFCQVRVSVHRKYSHQLLGFDRETSMCLRFMLSDMELQPFFPFFFLKLDVLGQFQLLYKDAFWIYFSKKHAFSEVPWRWFSVAPLAGQKGPVNHGNFGAVRNPAVRQVQRCCGSQSLRLIGVPEPSILSRKLARRS